MKWKLGLLNLGDHAITTFFALLVALSTFPWVIDPGSAEDFRMETHGQSHLIQISGTFFVVGAVLILIGLATIQPRIERMGLVLWLSNLITYEYVVFVGTSGSDRVVRTIIVVLLAMALSVRFSRLGQTVKARTVIVDAIVEHDDSGVPGPLGGLDRSVHQLPEVPKRAPEGKEG